jgi:enoyl-CoA hydratase
MPFDTIERTDHENGVVRISLDRPTTHNAQSPELIDELDQAVNEIEGEESTNVLIIDGNGPSFSSGHDMGRDDFKKDWTVEERVAFEEKYYFDQPMTLRDLDMPTIAQVHGYCGAAGLMLVSVCDLVVISETAEIANPVQRMAAAGTELLVEPWEVGFRKAKELLWTGDNISGTDAADLGLANRAVPRSDLQEETMKFANKIAQMPSFAISLSKKSLNFTRDQLGQRQAYRHHFMAHQLSHASAEWEEWHSEASDVLEEGGLSSWIEHRDEPFQDEDDEK